MPLAFRQWHLYRFDFMVDPKGIEPSTLRMRTVCSTGSFAFHRIIVYKMFKDISNLIKNSN